MLKNIDRLDSLHLAVDGLYERQETRLVKRLLKSGQVFIDVGAHIGYYSVMAANLGAKVFSFEPNAENYALLVANMAEFNQCAAYKVAVSDAAGQSRLFINKDNSGDHRLFETDHWNYIDVDTMRLDVAMASMEVNFLKIDVQGMECHVLRGAQQLIERSSDIGILVEYAPQHLRLAGSSPGELIGILMDLGFYIYAKADGKWVYADSCQLWGQTIRHQNLFCSRQPHNLIDWGNE